MAQALGRLPARPSDVTQQLLLSSRTHAPAELHTPESRRRATPWRLLQTRAAAAGVAQRTIATWSQANAGGDGIPVSQSDIAGSVAALVLAGGSSDNPLARDRAMPALEIGSNLRLIDIPISNCIRSGVNKMFVLTQYNSNALNTHVHTCYPPGMFGNARQRGFVDVLTANQTPRSTEWYRGSADAVRNNLENIVDVFDGEPMDDLLVLSGQALYNMDYGEVVSTHRSTGADITIVTHSIEEKDAGLRGLLRVNIGNGVVEKFAEKPGPTALAELSKGSRYSTKEQPYEASMGIYLFKRTVLEDLLRDKNTGGSGRQDEHFGYDVIPHALRSGAKVVAHHHEGYWLDVSSLRNFYDVNLSLAGPAAPLSIEEIHKGIVSRGSFCPPAIVSHCELESSLVGEGCVLRHSTLRNVVLGSNAFVDAGCVLEDTVVMGNSFYQNDAARADQRKAGEPIMGIGRNTQIKGAVIENNVSIGADVTIKNVHNVKEADRSETGGFIIQDGIILVLSGATILDGTRI